MAGNTHTASVVLSRIQNEHICPRPRWHFLLREGAVWSFGAFSVVTGSLAVAASLFQMRYAWWDFYSATHETFVTFVIDALPYMWLATFVLFGATFYASVRYTKRGYRYRIRTVLLASVLFSGFFGTVLYVIGVGEFIDENLGKFVPMHHSLIDRERAVWMHETEGRLAGIVREIPFSGESIWLEGIDGIPYEIDITGFERDDRTHVRIGDQVRVVGVPGSSAHVFHGCAIFMKGDDVLRHAHMLKAPGIFDIEMPSRSAERKVFFARSTLCKGVRPYARLVPPTQ